uniref:Uncharacterized protein n=1 Tax=Megaselia scalaris TaxID=36166 RepID=T1GM80_MEGSC
MKECWHHNANVRLPILNVRKKIKKIIDETDRMKTIEEEDEDKKLSNSINNCSTSEEKSSSLSEDRSNDKKNENKNLSFFLF